MGYGLFVQKRVAEKGGSYVLEAYERSDPNGGVPVETYLRLQPLGGGSPQVDTPKRVATDQWTPRQLTLRNAGDNDIEVAVFVVGTQSDCAVEENLFCAS